MEGCFMFQWGGHCFSDGGAPHGGHQFWWGGFEKSCKIGGGGTPCHAPHYGKPCNPTPSKFFPWTPHKIWLKTKINLQIQLYWSRGIHFFRHEIHSETNLVIITPYFGPHLY